ncbi:hypothetical protein [[Eubacterium] cellulosolvens]
MGEESANRTNPIVGFSRQSYDLKICNVSWDLNLLWNQFFGQRYLYSTLVIHSKMKSETKKSLKNNVSILIYAIFIIAIVMFSDNLNILSGSGTAEFVIILFSFLIVWQVFTQALQNESEQIKKKIMFSITIILVVLAVLGLIFFVLYQSWI